MIIEFLGVSGVGKTTVAKAYKRKLEKEGKEVIWDTYDLDARNGWLVRNIKKAFIVLAFSVSNPKWVLEYKRFLNKNISNIKDIPKPLFNAVFLKALLVKARKDGKIHIFDEGALQYLWAVKLRGNKTVSDFDIQMIRNLLGFPEQLISVTADSQVIKDRIVNRGEYVRIQESLDLISTISEMKRIQGNIEKKIENLIDVVSYFN